MARTIINNSGESTFSENQLLAVKDEKQKSKMTAAYEKRKEEQQVLLKRLEKKLLACK